MGLRTEDLVAILNGCEGVTVGPWKVVQSRDMTGDVAIKAPGLLNIMAEVFAARQRHDERSPETLPTAEHMARLDPETVKALVSELLAYRNAAPVDLTGLDAALDELRKPVDEVRE